MADDKQKVRVACKVPGGLMICKWKPGFDDGTGDGVKTTVRDGIAIRLQGPLHNGGTLNREGRDVPPGITEIDVDWRFADWIAQNKLNPYVAEGLIYEDKAEVPNEQA